jgi:chloramphenicol-sensitive protein RarD
MTDARRGLPPALTAFAIWGIFPLYFHALLQVDAIQVISHRIVWSCVFVLAVLVARRELGSLWATLKDMPALMRLTASAAMITSNWLAYVWGVLHGRVIETSLGYFIGPLVNVLLGVVLLSEKLTRAQWTAVLLAAIGVAYLTFMTGSLPWLALILAVSFATYGFIRKVVKVEALPGLATETLVLTPLAAGYLVWCGHIGTGALGHASPLVQVLLIGSGPITAIPLFLFAYATRLLPYSTVGLLQYLTPSLQFACGVFVLNEPFDRTRLIGFLMIWAALVLSAADGLRQAHRELDRTTA